KCGTVKRPDGKMQVTYAGYPLYFYGGDSKAGQVNGQGIEGEWHAIAPSGALVTKAAKPASTGGATTTTTSSNGGGYGDGQEENPRPCGSQKRADPSTPPNPGGAALAWGFGPSRTGVGAAA